MVKAEATAEFGSSRSRFFHANRTEPSSPPSKLIAIELWDFDAITSDALARRAARAPALPRDYKRSGRSRLHSRNVRVWSDALKF